MTIYFFGSKDGSGHHLHGGPLHEYDISKSIFPRIDTGFCPETEGYETQGHYKYTVIDGWSIISFWDRTGDSRHQSNSSFLVEGNVPQEQLWKAAREAFPKIFDRFDFDFVEVE